MTTWPETDQYLLPTLKSFRNKLLDLTTRNSLLSLSLNSQRTTRLLRFVDCNLQGTLDGLISGRRYSIGALPDPPRDKQILADDEAVRAALAQAREQDPLYQQVLADAQGDEATKTALAQADDRLRTAVLEELGKASKGSQSIKSLEAWAEQQGVNPSYSLSVANAGASDHGSLRVLLLGPRLERVAESIRKLAQSSIEETGNNILYLAFGCLEWSEKNKGFFAPLVLLPVELTKATSRGGSKTFYLCASDDAPVANVTLKERLRGDFGIDLPLPDLSQESVDLEGYFKAVAESVSELEDWHVHPFLNLTLFNFTGLGLYEDLVPEAVQASPLVRQLLAAEVREEELPDETEMIAEDVHVDQPEVAQRVPVLIAEADASQFAAIADVMAGRTLVIEGPPGTGKSQTITNMIANALYAGKRVLFVAEKKVAIDVVYTRLAQAGLKPYCLRIESDKANKKKIYDELAERLALVRPTPPRRETSLTMFEEVRDGLNQYADLLNTPHGRESHSHQSLLWRELQLRLTLQTSGIEPDRYSITLTQAIALDRPVQEGDLQLIEQMSKLLKARDVRRIQKSFDPITILPVDSFALDRLLEQAKLWQRSLQQLADQMAEVASIEALSLAALRQAGRRCVAMSERLPEPLHADGEALLPALSSPAIAEVVQSLLDAINEEEVAESSLLAYFERIPVPLPEVDSIHALINDLQQWQFDKFRIPADAEARSSLKDYLVQARQQIERIEMLVASAAEGLPLASWSAIQLKRIQRVLAHLSEQPDWVLAQRQHPVWRADPSRVRALLAEQHQLAAQRDELKLDQATVEALDDQGLRAAIADLERCQERGVASWLSQPDAAARWAQQIEAVSPVLSDLIDDLTELISGIDLKAVTLRQLQDLPVQIQSALALGPEALAQRMSALWEIPIEDIEAAVTEERALLAKELQLKQAGLAVPEGCTAEELRQAAEELDIRPFLSRVGGYFGRGRGHAKDLCRQIGAGKSRCEDLRSVAEVLELQQRYPKGWQRQRFGLDLSAESILEIAQRLQQWKAVVQRSSNGRVWLEWLRQSSESVLQQVLLRFKSALQQKLSALETHPVWPKPVADRSLPALHADLINSHVLQKSLEAAEPAARWARAAGVQHGDAMASWLTKVAAYRERLTDFPHSEWDQLLQGGLGPDQVETVTVAAQEGRRLVDAAAIQGLDAVVMGAEPAALRQAQSTIEHQLNPLLDRLFSTSELLGANAREQPLQQLFSSITDAAESYQQLLQRCQDAGLKGDVPLSALAMAPVDLGLAHRRRDAVLTVLANFQQQAGREIAGAPPDLLRQVTAWISHLRSLVLPLELEDSCLKPGSRAFIEETCRLGEVLTRALAVELETAETFCGMTGLDVSTLEGAETDSVEELQQNILQDWLSEISEQRESFQVWIRLQQLLERLSSDDIRHLMRQLLGSGLAEEYWGEIYRWNVLRNQLRQLSAEIPQLQQLNSSDQVSRRQRFYQLEDELRALDRQEVASAIHRDPSSLPLGINRGKKSEFTQMALIQNEALKQRRHRPLRHLFLNAGEALRGLKPCWMMSPGTLASLVPREGSEQFDLVIVDEASQMPPERAFGLISRARQCVVVGDPKQLPPTSFFQRTTSVDDADDDSEVDTEVLDEESILDLCTKTFHPVRRLKWHYRSRHGSLIAFSNQHFYNSELVVFPSCDRDFAIHRHLVTDARYTKGVNLPEVKLACDVVLEQLESYPDRSLGVVAMNEAQASEIGEQLEMLSFHHEELRRRLELKDTSEELFVKSLEKVQGDERDTIVISCTYGPSEPGGPVAMRFGPINQQGGHRRLNVLFTRAKRAIELVTSIESHQIHPTSISSQGVHAFRDYLKFVENQSLETGRPSGREPDSPFEVVVAESIKRHGYEVDCQVGVANYFIDLAIRHPEKPDSYLLGVECDGATYHSARAARDRDKYRQAVLEDLGWQIYRIWSTDWFENADAETRKLISHVEMLLGDQA